MAELAIAEMGRDELERDLIRHRVQWAEREKYTETERQNFQDRISALCRVLNTCHDNVRRLLEAVGTQGACEGCGAKIFWVMHKNGRRAPYTFMAANHYRECPDEKVQPVEDNGVRKHSEGSDSSDR